ncbi:hypothetical protein FACS1894151_07460 [Spirochaetia bacterium]|nr:hypothetical protein FACS1894151_07460 [Spirochaetia bacterium]
MDIDLFGNSVGEKALTSTQRIVTRQNISTGRDLYTTEPSDIDRFIRATKRDGIELSSPIWEPAAGRGDISKTLIKYGYEVQSTDIIAYNDQDIKVKELDFFSCLDVGAGIGGKPGTIFTNPPFNVQEEFLIHALSFGVDVIFFVRLSFLSGIRRLKIFSQYNPAYVYVYSARAHCYKNGDVRGVANMIDYVIIWKPPYKNTSCLRWIV